MPTEMQARVEYAWAYAKLKEDKGHKGRVDRMLPRMDEATRQNVQQDAGLSSAAAALAAETHYEATRAASSKNMPRPSATSEPSKAKK